jgi:hypothetical protein
MPQLPCVDGAAHHAKRPKVNVVDGGAQDPHPGSRRDANVTFVAALTIYSMKAAAASAGSPE